MKSFNYIMHPSSIKFVVVLSRYHCELRWWFSWSPLDTGLCEYSKYIGGGRKCICQGVVHSGHLFVCAFGVQANRGQCHGNNII